MDYKKTEKQIEKLSNYLKDGYTITDGRMLKDGMNIKICHPGGDYRHLIITIEKKL